MKKILAIVGSNSSNSINKQLAVYASSKLIGAEVDVFDLQNFEVPIYNIDIEKEKGYPEPIQALFNRIQEYNAFIILSPEHNGLMPAVLKNTIDWLTRIKGKFLNDKPVILMSTSPGGFGGANNLKVMSHLLPWWGGDLKATYSLRNFNENFDQEEQRITNSEENQKLTLALDKLMAA